MLNGGGIRTRWNISWVSGPSIAGCRSIHIKLRENIGILIKNYKSTKPGSNKNVMNPFTKNPKKKIQNFDFSICKIVLFLIMLLCISKEASLWVDSELKTKLETFEYWPSYGQKTTIFGQLCWYSLKPYTYSCNSVNF